MDPRLSTLGSRNIARHSDTAQDRILRKIKDHIPQFIFLNHSLVKKWIIAITYKRNLLDCVKKTVPEIRISVMPILSINLIRGAKKSFEDFYAWAGLTGSKQRRFSFKL